MWFLLQFLVIINVVCVCARVHAHMRAGEGEGEAETEGMVVCCGMVCVGDGERD